MPLKAKKTTIKALLSDFFKREDAISFYFLKQSKTARQEMTIIPYKSRKRVDLSKMEGVQLLLRDRLAEPDITFARWSDVIGKIIPLSSVLKVPFFDSRDVAEKAHPWRVCPSGEHWVRRHPKQLNSGKTTDHEGHCRRNEKRKTEFYSAEELCIIAETRFHELTNDPEVMPVPNDLGFRNGNKYDLLIAGWTKFWNEVLMPKQHLTPDLVKALIATESSFNQPTDQRSHDGMARGLIQITESTRRILQDLRGELKNHHLKLTTEQSREAATNIAAGVRWLHHKKSLMEKKLKREVTWEEAIIAYKGLSKQVGRIPKADEIVRKIGEYHKRLMQQRAKP